MDKQEKAARVEIGQRCKELRESEAFRQVIVALQTQYITEFVRLEPGSTTVDQRETLHLRLHALNEIEQEINMRVLVAEEILSSLYEDDEQEFKNA